MSFLLINGLEFGGYIIEGSLAETIREVGGGVSRAFDGSGRRSRIITHRDLSFEMVPQTLSDAFAMECVLLGLGHHWTFADGGSTFYSTKGLGPEAGYVATIVGSPGKFSTNGYLSLTATTGTISFTLYPSDDLSNYTAMFWRYESGAWHHYVINSLTYKWRDGVRDDALATGWFDDSSYPVITFTNTTGSAVLYDELDLLPCVLPTTWPPLIYASGYQFGDSPRVSLVGDVIAEKTTRYAMGHVNSKMSKLVLSGTLQSARTLSVTLEES